MKKSVLFLLAAAFLARGASAQTSSQDQQKAMEAYMKAGAVTENHALLKSFVGRWETTATMWAVPGAPPTTSKNEVEGELILGGRFVRMNYRGTMMGQPFEGIQVTGYDNLQKAFVTVWVDNTSTSLYLLSGTYDPVKKTYTNTGKWAGPMGGLTPVRMVIRVLGPDEYISETFMTLPDGKEFKSMEDRTVRKK